MAVSQELKTIMRTELAAFGGERQMRRFYNDDESVSVDILHCADRPRPGVTSWGTIGLSEYPSGFRSAEGVAIRSELVGEMASSVTTFGNMLAACVFNVAVDEYGIDPETIYPDIVSDYEPDGAMKHMLITDVSSFEGLTSIDRGTEIVTFLQAIPVSDPEFEFARRSGVEALVDRMAEAGVDILDLNRGSVA